MGYLETLGTLFFRLCNSLGEKLGFPKYHSKWVEEEVLCRKLSDSCFQASCQDCRSGHYFWFKHPLGQQENADETVNLEMWQKGSSGYLNREKKVVLLDRAVNMFEEALPKFITHHLTKRNQSAMYLLHKQERKRDEIVIHFDFAENFTCSQQDQIQSAYYHQRQVSIFTSVIYDSQGTHCMVLCSDDCDHSKRTVVAYILELFEVSQI
jgi:hypothetical protein